MLLFNPLKIYLSISGAFYRIDRHDVGQTLPDPSETEKMGAIGAFQALRICEENTEIVQVPRHVEEVFNSNLFCHKSSELGLPNSVPLSVIEG